MTREPIVERVLDSVRNRSIESTDTNQSRSIIIGRVQVGKAASRAIEHDWFLIDPTNYIKSLGKQLAARPLAVFSNFATV